jgi:hypothetical protein
VQTCRAEPEEKKKLPFHKNSRREHVWLPDPETFLISGIRFSSKSVGHFGLGMDGHAHDGLS